MTLTNKDEQRFWAKVNKTDACWLWMGYKDADGYGVFGYTPQPNQWQPIHAHRASALFSGRNPQGLLVCHHCDNPSCVRPDHLFLGTYHDNRTDCVVKDRAGSKLKAADILYIRANTVKGPRGPASRKISNVKAMADQFNVNAQTILDIVNRKIWTHI